VNEDKMTPVSDLLWSGTVHAWLSFTQSWFNDTRVYYQTIKTCVTYPKSSLSEQVEKENWTELANPE